MKTNIQEQVEAALRATGLRWSIDKGKRHRCIKLDGKLVAILPLYGTSEKGRALKNVIAQIRRQARNAGGAA